VIGNAQAVPRLRRSDCSAPGIVRRRRGKGFSYTWPDGSPVDDPDTAERIAALVIPPAWTDVWISPWPHGHIQATGTDAAGRRQYRYHDEWRKRRDLEKFERMVRFGRCLPAMRERVEADLQLDGYPKDKVLAASIRLLDVGYFRIGGEEYAEEHETFGLATMEREHVRVSGDTMHFDYPAKGGLRRQITVTDPQVAAIVRGLKRRRSGGADLLAWKEGGRWCDVRADDVNGYLKEIADEEFSAKDFRTWSATVLAAIGVALASPGASKTAGRRLVSAVCKEVSSHLGNTPAVCRGSYIDPRVFDRHESGETIAAAIERLAAHPDATDPAVRVEVESAVIDLLEAEQAGQRRSLGQPSSVPPERGSGSKPKRRSAASSSTSANSTSRAKPGSSRSPSSSRSPAPKAA
jgi:DNA topoisomerase-1